MKVFLVSTIAVALAVILCKSIMVVMFTTAPQMQLCEYEDSFGNGYYYSAPSC